MQAIVDMFVAECYAQYQYFLAVRAMWMHAWCDVDACMAAHDVQDNIMLTFGCDFQWQNANTWHALSVDMVMCSHWHTGSQTSTN